MEKSLIDNALDFIDRAARDLWDPALRPEQQLKYSTVELYEGIELILKARLLQEHWSLVIADINRHGKKAFDEGDFISVNLQNAWKRLKEFCDEDLDPKILEAFDALRKLRNRYVHFSCKETRANVMAIQLKAWHHILHLLGNNIEMLGPLHEMQATILEAARANMHKSDEYLVAKFNELGSTISELDKSENVFIVTCPDCSKRALCIGDPGDGFPKCLVCEIEFDGDRLADEYAYSQDHWWKHPKHGVDDDLGWCTECGFQSVVPADEVSEKIANYFKNVPRESGEDWEYWLCFCCGNPEIGPPRHCHNCGASFFNFSEESSCPACDGYP